MDVQKLYFPLMVLISTFVKLSGFRQGEFYYFVYHPSNLYLIMSVYHHHFCDLFYCVCVCVNWTYKYYRKALSLH